VPSVAVGTCMQWARFFGRKHLAQTRGVLYKNLAGDAHAVSQTSVDVQVKKPHGHSRGDMYDPPSHHQHLTLSVLDGGHYDYSELGGETVARRSKVTTRALPSPLDFRST